MEEAGGGGRPGAWRETEEAGGTTQMRPDLRAPSPTRCRAASNRRPRSVQVRGSPRRSAWCGALSGDGGRKQVAPPLPECGTRPRRSHVPAGPVAPAARAAVRRLSVRGGRSVDTREGWSSGARSSW
jgi:hypothetical protein